MAYKEGMGWEAHFDGERCVVKLCDGDRMQHQWGYWQIDGESFNKLNDENARELILGGRCIFFYVDSFYFGTQGTIYDADAEALCAWDPHGKELLQRARMANFVDDYPNNLHRRLNEETPLDAAEPYTGEDKFF